MCIVFWHTGTETEDYSLIVCSNRDEFLARPTSSAAWHDWSTSSPSDGPTEKNRVLSGLDLTAGGTWFGVSLRPSAVEGANPVTGRPALRFATLTNFTETIPPGKRPSRGKLTRDFLDLGLKQPLASADSPSFAQETTPLEEYLGAVDKVKHEYAGFNLLVGEINPSSASSPSSSSSATRPVRLAYISNRESPSKRARILDPHSASCLHEGKSVRGLSNATLEVEEGEEEWPKVKSGALAVDEAVREVRRKGLKGREAEDELVKGLYDALSTPHPSPITHRIHLRHTVLVRPFCLDPTAPLPAAPPPLPLSSNFTTTTATSLAGDPPMDVHHPVAGAKAKKEGEDGLRWYATRVQTVLVVGKDGTCVVRERDAYVLCGEEDGEENEGKPKWSGEERRFEFNI
ncbi:hypothetical protein JCM11251_001989 [Rhodosporidiobolus azoricus]